MEDALEFISFCCSTDLQGYSKSMIFHVFLEINTPLFISD